MDQIRVRSIDHASRVVVQVGWWVSWKDALCAGTGIIIDEHHVLTAMHVVDHVKSAGKPLAVIVFDRGFHRAGYGEEHSGVTGAKPLGSDLALLDLSEPLTFSWGAFRLAAVEPTVNIPAPGAIVDAYGSPATRHQHEDGSTKHLVLCSGLLHMRRHVQEAAEHELRVSYPTPPGFSGGPLFNDEGLLIGVAARSAIREEGEVTPGVYVQGFSFYERIDHVLPLRQGVA